MNFTHSWCRHERLGIAARCCGAAERLIDEATSFAKERKAFGDFISNFQAIQFMLAESVNDLWSAKLMLYETCKAHDAGVDVKILHAKCSMVKLYASEIANKNSEESLSDGVKMVSSKIEKYFESLDVKPYGDVGDDLNPEIHDAMMTKTDESRDDNVILDVFEKGFTYRDKVIRHAKVIVNKK